MKQYRDSGVVLRTWKLGEADRIVVVMTRGNGKVRCVAKGVRKTKSSFGSRLEPGGHVELQLHRGRELDVIAQAERIDVFGEIRSDLDRLGRASAILEAVDQTTPDREPDAAIYRMLVGALKALDEGAGPGVVPAFFLKLLAQEGLRPEVDACVVCSADADLVAFDLEVGGVLCRSHRSGQAITPEVLDLLQRTLGGGLVSVLAETESPALAQLEALATRALEIHVERRLRSLNALG